MKLKYLYENANNLLQRLYDSDSNVTNCSLFERTYNIPAYKNKLSQQAANDHQYSNRRWRFVANPTCCELCKYADGFITYSDEEPRWYGHAPGVPERCNCKCRWDPVDTNEQV